VRGFLLAIAASALAAGCATDAVVPLGRDAYAISSPACGTGATESASAELRRRAAAFCAQQAAELTSADARAKGGIPFLKCPSVELQFRCAAKEGTRQP